MGMLTNSQTSVHEQMVIRIVRRLPAERILQIVDFARFLELETTRKHEDWLDEDEEEPQTEEEIRDSEEKWDALLAQPDAKRLMRDMACEALEDYRTGRTTDITITETNLFGACG